MTIIAIMFAADDEDVVESSVRHNLHYVDAVFVVGIDSRDQTRSIVERLAEEGVPVAYNAALPGTTRLAHASAALRQLADQDHIEHVALLGAECFLEGDPLVFRDAILTDPFAIHLVPRTVRVPCEDDDWAEMDPYRRLAHRRLTEFEPRHLAILPRRIFATAPVNPDGFYAEDDLPGAQPLGGIGVSQLPVRNAWQLGALVATRVGEITTLAEEGIADRTERVRFWLKAAAHLRRQPLLSHAELRELAACFEEEAPVPLLEDRPIVFADHEIRYPAEAARHLDRVEEIIRGEPLRGTPGAVLPPN